jgi:hypothetical protein
MPHRNTPPHGVLDAVLHHRSSKVCSCRIAGLFGSRPGLGTYSQAGGSNPRRLKMNACDGCLNQTSFPGCWEPIKQARACFNNQEPGCLNNQELGKGLTAVFLARYMDYRWLAPAVAGWRIGREGEEVVAAWVWGRLDWWMARAGSDVDGRAIVAILSFS